MFKGSLVALVTPMLASGAIDWSAWQKLIEFHLEKGSHGLVVAGTTGEAATLNKEEFKKLLSRCVQICDKKIPVIAGTGTNNTQTTIENTRLAADLGADACLLVTPYYNKPEQIGLLQHFTSVATNVNIPQLLYNVSGRTGCDLLPATVQQLAANKNIIGIKEASNDRQRYQQLRQLCPQPFCLLSGDDDSALTAMREGADGVISVTANVAPHLMAQMTAAALANHWSVAEQLNSKLQALHNTLFVESNPIPVKWALARLGMMDNILRLPLTALSSKHEEVLTAALQQAELL